ncbi:MAG: T9SS type A sorting domain-containing protein [Candidatus Marinimicrobia bacterium]|jgi:hypothetical protein|nr:T9SS type A sorting domain-containing protein [Candidatus Neomarinimicrobiota bacterium]MBT3839574.1 T9SS type A sorting domain-containing protein [Candidatus Neomarinimicrobiota bacterium]MBT3999711.1 T9SS type A sorting domain-containing protein [Candidatus Neomarinimicrobiota bacterium]MBT4282100.1 T9SS type A sorting domain-containing protein [Candidatus Neomarinimicrobiota bacterium]MBT4578839.1 T9SS type A sorting domain-containing protein [Candidatus Neomarinimicrobiota bacterium]
MKKTVMLLFALSICFAGGNLPPQMDKIVKALQNKYQIYSLEDISKLNNQPNVTNARTSSRDMGDLIGGWHLEDNSIEMFVTVGTDQTIINALSMMGMAEANGSISATASDYSTELTYLLDASFMDGGGNSDCEDIYCEGEYNDYYDYGYYPSDMYCECCSDEYYIDDYCYYGRNNSRNTDALGFAQDYVNDNSIDWGESAFDLESEFSLVVDGDDVSGGLGGTNPENCEINWPDDPFKIAVYSFVSEYVLGEGGSIGCFLDSDSLDQSYADFVGEMEDEWTNGGDDDDGESEPELLIMNMNLMEFFMIVFGADFDSINVENPTVLAVGSSNGENLDMVFGLMFNQNGVLELMADSAAAALSTSIDTMNFSLTFNNLSLVDSLGMSQLTVNGTIGPGMLEFIAGEETSIDLSLLFGDENEEEDLSIYLYEDSTGMDVSISYDDYYGEEWTDTSYFQWEATSDSVFLYYESDYYDEESDTMAMEYEIEDGTLYVSASENPCEEEYDSYEDCFSEDDIYPGLDQLEDVEDFKVSFESVFESVDIASVDPLDGLLPLEHKLYTAYPNPFNPVTTIRFDVGDASHESILRIYDISGRNVATLVKSQLQAGTYEVQWDASQYASGVYFTELISGINRYTQKMILLK